MQDSSFLKLDLDGLEIEEIEVFLQEGSKGVPALGASCSTICYYFCCTPSCGGACVAAAVADPTPAVENSLEVPED